jgi:hypothetical protein
MFFFFVSVSINYLTVKDLCACKLLFFLMFLNNKIIYLKFESFYTNLFILFKIIFQN